MVEDLYTHFTNPGTRSYRLLAGLNAMSASESEPRMMSASGVDEDTGNVSQDLEVPEKPYLTNTPEIWTTSKGLARRAGL